MLVLQDPTDEQSTALFESLADAFVSAQKIAGAFAFASSEGIRLVTSNEQFLTVAQSHPVELVVGIDAVTDERALERLVAVTRDLPNVSARVFLHSLPEARFHPKFCWTKTAQGGRLIAGSGNLTVGGLLRNWEAYTITELDRAGIDAIEAMWDAWKARHAASLRALDDPEVQLRAAANTIMAQEGDLPTLVAEGALPEPDASAAALAMPDTAGVLIAEIPKNRPGQVNYHMSDYRDFFGWREGVTRFVSFRRVSDDGTVAEFEFSTVVISDSGNFRFELAGARGQLNYGSASAIGVYVRVATREFFYCILRPGEAAFDSIGRLLDRREGVPAARVRGGRPMRSTQMTVSELRQEWADAPFWRIPPSERSDNF